MISREKQRRLKRLSQVDVEDMCRRYLSECRELGTHIETKEEKDKRLAIRKAKENNRWRLTI